MPESTTYQESPFHLRIFFSPKDPGMSPGACLARVRADAHETVSHIICQADSLPYLKQILKGSVLVIVSLDRQLWPERDWLYPVGTRERNQHNAWAYKVHTVFGSDGFRLQPCHSDSFCFFALVEQVDARSHVCSCLVCDRAALEEVKTAKQQMSKDQKTSSQSQK